MQLHIFQHEATCGAGFIDDWCAARGIGMRVTRFDRGDAVPALETVDSLLILGGSMNVYQDADFPHLKAAREFTRAALEAEKRVFGICLGAQMMADALGSRVVRAAEEEAGWVEIERRDEADSSPLLSWLPARERFVSWHGDTFVVPDGAVHGARSGACSAQAFSWRRRALAVQFHPEASAAIVSGWIENEPEEKRAGWRDVFLPFESRFERQKLLLFAALDAWMSA